MLKQIRNLQENVNSIFRSLNLNNFYFESVKPIENQYQVTIKKTQEVNHDRNFVNKPL